MRWDSKDTVTPLKSGLHMLSWGGCTEYIYSSAVELFVLLFDTNT